MIKENSNIIHFIGKGYSKYINDTNTDIKKLESLSLPIILNDMELANFLNIKHNRLKSLCYFKSIGDYDNYFYFLRVKKSSGYRKISAPKPILKKVQKIILNQILLNIPISENTHGYIRGRSIITGARSHLNRNELLIKMDLKDFFPTITFDRVRGIFQSFGYSGHISTLLAMICTYNERKVIKKNGKKKYLSISDRVLPQGSPASPAITNIICRRFDKRLNRLSKKFGFKYSRYADDIVFSVDDKYDIRIKQFTKCVYNIIQKEGFYVNKDKTQFLRKSNQQLLLGLLTNNEKISMPKTWIKNFRATLFNGKKLILDLWRNEG